MIHGTGIFTYIYHTSQTIHVGKYTNPMDPILETIGQKLGDLLSTAQKMDAKSSTPQFFWGKKPELERIGYKWR